MTLFDRIDNISPRYREVNDDIVLEFTVKGGGQDGFLTKETRYTEGKYFLHVYHMYMYAAFLGLKNDARLPIEKGEKAKKFIELKSFKPEDCKNVLVGLILSKIKYEFFELENFEDKDLKIFQRDFRIELESYANGGFEIIKDKRKEIGSIFKETENRFMDIIVHD